MAAADELDDLDELDAVSEGEDEVAGPGLNSFKGFAAGTFRSFPVDRDKPGNTEQALFEAQLELDLRVVGNLSAFVRTWLLIDALDTDLRRLYEPLEGYLSYRAESWDVTAGQFIESWGIADAANPLNVLNRRDIGVDFFDPVDRGELGLRVRAHFSGGEVFGQPTLALYAMPVFRETPFPTSSNRLSFAQGGLTLDEDLAETPRATDAVFAAVRFEHTLATPLFNADLQYVAARGPEHAPTFEPVATATGIAIAPKYYGTWIAGGGFRAVPNADWWSQLTLKAEVVYKHPYVFDDVPLLEAPDDYVQFATGFDRTISEAFSALDQITLTVEYIGEHGADDPSTRLRPFEHDVAVRAFWERGDFARTGVELRAIVDVTSGERIAEASFQRQLRFIHDDLQFKIDGRYVAPDSSPESLFGAFPNSSHVRTRLRFDF